MKRWLLQQQADKKRSQEKNRNADASWQRRRNEQVRMMAAMDASGVDTQHIKTMQARESVCVCVSVRERECECVAREGEGGWGVKAEAE